MLSLAGILINEIVEAFDLEGASEGLMGSMVSVGFLLSLFVIPLLQGRVRKLTMLIFGGVFQALALSMVGMSPVFSFLGAACVILGFVGGFIDTYCNSSIVDVWKDKSARYLGYLHGVFGVGSLLAPLLIFWMLRHMDWRGVHYYVAAFSLLAALFVLLLKLRSGKAGTEEATREKTLSMESLAEYLKNKRSIILAITGFLAAFAQTGLLAWIVRYLAVQFGTDDFGAAALSAYWLGATVNRFCLSQLTARAPWKYFAIGTVLFAALLVAGVMSESPFVLTVMVGASGLVSGQLVPVLVSQSAVGHEGKTTLTTSFILIVMGVGRAAAPLLMAIVSTQISYVAGMMVPAATAIAAGACGLVTLKVEKGEPA